MNPSALASAFALSIALGIAGPTSSQTIPAPNIGSPLLNLSGFGAREAVPPPLSPRADGLPPDVAFGAYQRGNFLAALKEAGAVYLNGIGGAAQYYARTVEMVLGVSLMEFGIPERCGT